MELFYSTDIQDGLCRLDAEEALHCTKVLRHKNGDEINVIDGKGTMYTCRITNNSPHCTEAEIISQSDSWGAHPYILNLAVCPTKNADRYEWFAQKACEVGFDRLIPIIGEHSERRVCKTSRLDKILVSAAKQSLKAAIPIVDCPVSVIDFIEATAKECDENSNCVISDENSDGGKSVDRYSLKLIAYCFEDSSMERLSIKDALETFRKSFPCGHTGEARLPEITVLIGPEGDFSEREASLAIKRGFIPVHLGKSRLRTETAALTAAEAVYFCYM